MDEIQKLSEWLIIVDEPMEGLTRRKLEIDRMLDEGKQAFLEGNYKIALERFEQVLRIKPNPKQALELRERAGIEFLVDVMTKGGKFKNFADWLIEHAVRDPNSIPGPDRIAQLFEDLKSGDDGTSRWARQMLTTETGKPRPEVIDLILKEMEEYEYRFRPDALLNLGHPGLQAVLDRVLREIPGNEEIPQDREERLRKFREALYAYTGKVTDVRCHEVLARRAVWALERRFDKKPESRIVKTCIMALWRCRDRKVHELLLPLLMHEDPAVPEFALKAIAGRAGVTPIHLEALRSGRKRLVKCALNCMPCPIFGPRHKAVVGAVYRKIFETRDPAWNFDDDPEFLRGHAFVAARDFRMESAREVLLKAIRSTDVKVALDAIYSLGDTYYIGTPLDSALLEALEPHLRSTDPRFRSAALDTLHYYKGKGIVMRLITALADKDPTVAIAAGRHLVQRCRYYKSEHERILRALQKSLETADSPGIRKRIALLINRIKKG
jgi:HEAT repeat protein